MSRIERRRAAWRTMPTFSRPFRAELAVQLERVRGRRRVLHVDPDEVAALGRVADDLEQVRAAELVREVEPERGQLDADVRVQALALDRLEDVVVGANDVLGLAPARRFLAEDVDRRHLPLGVELLHDPDGVRDRRPGDVAVRDPADERPRHCRQDADDGSIELCHSARIIATTALTESLAVRKIKTAIEGEIL